MRFRGFASAFALCLSLVLAYAVHARDAPIPKDADQFTAYMAKRFTEADPAAKVTVAGPLTLNVERTGGGHTVYLANMWSICERDRRQCRKQIDTFIPSSLAIQSEFKGDIKPEDIRVVVRGASYVRQLEQMGAKDPSRMGIYRPIAGDLWEICVVDAPHGIETLQKGAAAKLGLTDEQAFALGVKNVAAALPSLAADTHSLKMGLTFAAGDFYESSRILLHDGWADLSKADNGHLVVAVPSNDVVVYGNGGGNGDRSVERFCEDRA